MKRRSMLGRRSRVVQQSPAKTIFQVQENTRERSSETPRMANRDRTPNVHPFHTPSFNGSLSTIGMSDNDTWSVFKNSNVRALKSPLNNEERRANPFQNHDIKPAHSIRLNKLKKTDPLSEMRDLGFLNVQSTKTLPIHKALPDRTQSAVRPFNRGILIQKNVTAKSSCESKDSKERVNESEDERISRELNQLKKTWDYQDIRTVSPPWSNGLNSLSDFNLSNPRHTPSISVTSPRKEIPANLVDLSTSLGVKPLESTIVEDGTRDKKSKEDDKSFTELENIVNKGESSQSKSMDLSMALSDVLLGVNTLELLHQSNTASMHKMNWGSKFRSPLQKVEEESEASTTDKENMPPNNFQESTVSSLSADETMKVISEANSPSCYSRDSTFKQFQDSLSDLTSKIETIEEKRTQLEEERRELEVERKQVLVEFFKFIDTNETPGFQPEPKRRKTSATSSGKKRPSYVASKLLKKEFKSPKVDHLFLRTPSQSASLRPIVSKLNPYTPKSLRKSINQQFNSIFGS